MDRGFAGQDVERLVVRYTGCSLSGRHKLVSDVYFGSAVFGAANGDPLDELFDQFASTVPSLLCVPLKRVQVAA
jgi:hypothetical protein